MSEHVCEKKNKKHSPFRKLMLCLVGNLWFWNETTFLSYGIKSLTTNFPGLGQQGLVQHGGAAALAVLSPGLRPHTLLSTPGAAHGSGTWLSLSRSEGPPAPTRPALWCHWGIDGRASSQAALWLSVHERQKQRLWSAEARFPTDFLFYLNPMSKANLETTGERASRNCRRCTDVRWEEEETGALGPACLRLSHREQCPELWPASLQFVGWNTQQANWCSCWSKTHGGTCGTDSVLFICSLNFRLHVWSEKINIHHLIHYIFFPNISQRKKQQGLGSLLCDGRCILSALSRCSVALQEVPPLLRSLNSLPSTLGGIHFEVRFATQTTKIRVFCSA